MEAEDIADYRQRTISRLIDKRRQDRVNEEKQAKERWLKENKFRIDWREGFKKKRSDAVASNVDKYILRETIKQHPDLVVGSSDAIGRGVNTRDAENDIKALIEDFNTSHETMGWGFSRHTTNEHGQNVTSISKFGPGGNSRVPFLGSPAGNLIPQRSTEAMRFLQNSVTFNLAINQRLKEQQEHQRRLESDLEHLNSLLERKKSSRSLLRSDSDRSSSSSSLFGYHHGGIQPLAGTNTSNGSNDVLPTAGTGSGGSGKKDPTRLFNSYQNEMQVKDLLQNLLERSVEERQGGFAATARDTSAVGSNDNGSHHPPHDNDPLNTSTSSGGGGVGDGGGGSRKDKESVDLLGGRRIKTTGLMSRFIRPGAGGVPGAATGSGSETPGRLSRKNSFSLSRRPSGATGMMGVGGGGITPQLMSRMASRTNSIAAAAAAGGYATTSSSSAAAGDKIITGTGVDGLGIEDGSIIGAGGAVVDAAGMIMDEELLAAMEGGDGDNPFFCSLVDSVFMIGPSCESINEQLKAKLAAENKNIHSNGNGNDQSSNSDNINDNSMHASIREDFSTRLTPTIVYMTQCNNPEEMFSLLPSYCFPSGVDFTVTANIRPSTASAATGAKKGGTGAPKRKSTLNLLAAKIISESITDVARGARRKNMSLFSSDYGGNETSGTNNYNANNSNNNSDPIKEDGTKPTSSTPTNSSSSSHNNNKEHPSKIPNKNQFILLLGDHTYQQYGVCAQLPMSFHNLEFGVTIHTSYVICLMSKLPMFSYLYHILDHFDQAFDGFKYNSPIPTQDIDFPYLSPELKSLNDLAAKLKRVQVPKYPYVMNAETDHQLRAHKLAVETAGAGTTANTSSSGGGGTTAVPAGAVTGGVGGDPGEYNAALEQEHPLLENEQDTKAILPDIEFVFGMTMPKKFSTLFKRSIYQSYFSLSSLKFEGTNKGLSDLIAHFDQQVADFVPATIHRTEKEKEDSYMILLWALPVLLKYLPLDQIILALGCAITEMKIIVKHQDFHVISSIVLALVHLLKPMRWCSPVIVILPDELADFVESPVPIIIGMQKLPENFLLLERFVVIDPQERIVHLNPIDVVESHTILLPHASKLVNAIRTSADTVLKCTKKKRAGRGRKSALASASNISSHSTAAGGDGLHHPNTTSTGASSLDAGAVGVPVAVPVDLDTDSYENLQLLAAVKTFSGLVANHIQAILNTAIQMQHASHQAAQNKRRMLIRNNGTIKPKQGGGAIAPELADKDSPSSAAASSSPTPAATAVGTAATGASMAGAAAAIHAEGGGAGSSAAAAAVSNQHDGRGGGSGGINPTVVSTGSPNGGGASSGVIMGSHAAGDAHHAEMANVAAVALLRGMSGDFDAHASSSGGISVGGGGAGGIATSTSTGGGNAVDAGDILTDATGMVVNNPTGRHRQRKQNQKQHQQQSSQPASPDRDYHVILRKSTGESHRHDVSPTRHHHQQQKPRTQQRTHNSPTRSPLPGGGSGSMHGHSPIVYKSNHSAEIRARNAVLARTARLSLESDDWADNSPAHGAAAVSSGRHSLPPTSKKYKYGAEASGSLSTEKTAAAAAAAATSSKTIREAVGTALHSESGVGGIEQEELKEPEEMFEAEKRAPKLRLSSASNFSLATASTGRSSSGGGGTRMSKMLRSAPVPGPPVKETKLSHARTAKFEKRKRHPQRAGGAEGGGGVGGGTESNNDSANPAAATTTTTVAAVGEGADMEGSGGGGGGGGGGAGTRPRGTSQDQRNSRTRSRSRSGSGGSGSTGKDRGGGRHQHAKSLSPVRNTATGIGRTNDSNESSSGATRQGASSLSTVSAAGGSATRIGKQKSASSSNESSPLRKQSESGSPANKPSAQSTTAPPPSLPPAAGAGGNGLAGNLEQQNQPPSPPQPLNLNERRTGTLKAASSSHHSLNFSLDALLQGSEEEGKSKAETVAKGTNMAMGSRSASAEEKASSGGGGGSQRVLNLKQIDTTSKPTGSTSSKSQRSSGDGARGIAPLSSPKFREWSNKFFPDAEREKEEEAPLQRAEIRGSAAAAGRDGGEAEYKTLNDVSELPVGGVGGIGAVPAAVTVGNANFRTQQLLAHHQQQRDRDRQSRSLRSHGGSGGGGGGNGSKNNLSYVEEEEETYSEITTTDIGAPTAAAPPNANTTTASAKNARGEGGVLKGGGGDGSSNINDDGDRIRSDSMSAEAEEGGGGGAGIVEESIADSISSSVSSLPSLRQNAPMLMVREIGQSGVKFMERLQETQMYSNYCQYLKTQSASLAEKQRLLAEEEARLSLHATGDASGGGGGSGGDAMLLQLHRPSISSRSRNASILGTTGSGSTSGGMLSASRAARSRSFSFSRQNSFRSNSSGDGNPTGERDDENDEMELDSLIEVFVIMLTGTVMMDDDCLMEETQRVQNLYGDDEGAQELLIREIGEEHAAEFLQLRETFQEKNLLSALNHALIQAAVQREQSAVPPHYPTTLSHIHDESLLGPEVPTSLPQQHPSAPLPSAAASSAASVASVASSSALSTTHTPPQGTLVGLPQQQHPHHQNTHTDRTGGEILWCNGLICNGLCNTPFCTSICMNLWEKKVQKVRQQAVFKNIISKHQRSTEMMKSVVKLSTSLAQSADPYNTAFAQVNAADAGATGLAVSGLNNQRIDGKASSSRAARKQQQVKQQQLQLQQRQQQRQKLMSLAGQPTLDVVRHPMETQQQFELRQALVAERKQRKMQLQTAPLHSQLVGEKGSDQRAEKRRKKKQARNRSIYGPAIVRGQFDGRSQNTSSAASLASITSTNGGKGSANSSLVQNRSRDYHTHNDDDKNNHDKSKKLIFRKKVLYARPEDCDGATAAIARYYVKKQEKVLRAQVKAAFRTIKPLMLRFVALYRKFKFHTSLIYIQAIFRGYHVRNHIPELVEALITRRRMRFLACIRIRRFVRQNDELIFNNYIHNKLLQQRRRRNMLSIPTTRSILAITQSSNNGNPNDISSVNNNNTPAGDAVGAEMMHAAAAAAAAGGTYGANGMTNERKPRVYRISDDVPEDLLPISAVTGAAGGGLGGFNTTTTAAAAAGEEGAPVRSMDRGEKLAAGAGSSTGASATRYLHHVDTPRYNSPPHAGNDATSAGVGGSEIGAASVTSAAATGVEGAVTGGDTRSSSGRPAAAASGAPASTYADRVKEYLQFGKILNRNPTTTATKYAAHYLSRRKSKETSKMEDIAATTTSTAATADAGAAAAGGPSPLSSDAATANSSGGGGGEGDDERSNITTVDADKAGSPGKDDPQSPSLQASQLREEEEVNHHQTTSINIIPNNNLVAPSLYLSDLAGPGGSLDSTGPGSTVASTLTASPSPLMRYSHAQQQQQPPPPGHYAHSNPRMHFEETSTASAVLTPKTGPGASNDQPSAIDVLTSTQSPDSLPEKAVDSSAVNAAAGEGRLKESMHELDMNLQIKTNKSTSSDDSKQTSELLPVQPDEQQEQQQQQQHSVYSFPSDRMGVTESYYAPSSEQRQNQGSRAGVLSSSNKQSPISSSIPLVDGEYIDSSVDEGDNIGDFPTAGHRNRSRSGSRTSSESSPQHQHSNVRSPKIPSIVPESAAVGSEGSCDVDDSASPVHTAGTPTGTPTGVGPPSESVRSTRSRSDASAASMPSSYFDYDEEEEREEHQHHHHGDGEDHAERSRRRRRRKEAAAAGLEEAEEEEEEGEEYGPAEVLGLLPLTPSHLAAQGSAPPRGLEEGDSSSKLSRSSGQSVNNPAADLTVEPSTATGMRFAAKHNSSSHSSNNNKNPRLRRRGSTSSATSIASKTSLSSDAEQPVLISIVGQQYRHRHSIGGNSGSNPDDSRENSIKGEIARDEEDVELQRGKQHSVRANDSNNKRRGSKSNKSNRSRASKDSVVDSQDGGEEEEEEKATRASTSARHDANTTAAANEASLLKKLSPIGRYAAENSYDMSRLVSPRVAAGCATAVSTGTPAAAAAASTAESMSADAPSGNYSHSTSPGQEANNAETADSALAGDGEIGSSQPLKSARAGEEEVEAETNGRRTSMLNAQDEKVPATTLQANRRTHQIRQLMGSVEGGAGHKAADGGGGGGRDGSAASRNPRRSTFWSFSNSRNNTIYTPRYSDGANGSRRGSLPPRASIAGGGNVSSNDRDGIAVTASADDALPNVSSQKLSDVMVPRRRSEQSKGQFDEQAMLEADLAAIHAYNKVNTTAATAAAGNRRRNTTATASATTAAEEQWARRNVPPDTTQQHIHQLRHESTTTGSAGGALGPTEAVVNLQTATASRSGSGDAHDGLVGVDVAQSIPTITGSSTLSSEAAMISDKELSEWLPTSPATLAPAVPVGAGTGASTVSDPSTSKTALRDGSSSSSSSSVHPYVPSAEARVHINFFRSASNEYGEDERFGDDIGGGAEDGDRRSGGSESNLEGRRDLATGTGTGTDKEGKLSASSKSKKSNHSSKKNHNANSSSIGGEVRDEEEEEEEDDYEDDEEEEEDEKDDLLEAIKAAPLKTLGCNIMDYLNRQQLHALLDMWKLLRSGVEIIKHGRRGAPKYKTLLCDVNCTKLYWRSSGSRTEADQDDLPQDYQYYPTLLNPSAGAAELASGVNIAEALKQQKGEASNHSATHNFFSWGSAHTNADRVLYIRDILQVRDDCASDVLQRSLSKRYIQQDGPNAIISIKLADRTVDFEIDDDSWTAIYHPLQILVNFYQVMVNGPRASISLGNVSSTANFLTYDNTTTSNPSIGTGTGGSVGGVVGGAVSSAGAAAMVAPPAIGGARRRSTTGKAKKVGVKFKDPEEDEDDDDVSRPLL